MENEFDDDIGTGSPTGGLSGSRLLMLSILSASFYLFLALLIYHFLYEEGIAEAFAHGLPVTMQFLAGIIAGGLAAACVGFVIVREPVAGVLKDFYIVEAISKIRFNNFDRFQLSLFAGAGEELLFRGAIQPLLGIWITSIIFVGLHGYFKFKSAGHIVFGLLMFGLSVMLGYLFREAGLIAAMTAHAVYDLIMLKWMDQMEFGNSHR
jgi:membrane protease YdiL (CAAX protease family)